MLKEDTEHQARSVSNKTDFGDFGLEPDRDGILAVDTKFIGSKIPGEVIEILGIR